MLAFPTPAAESVRMAERSPRVTYGLDRKPFDSANLLDGNPATSALFRWPEPSLTQYLNIEFPEAFTAQSLTMGLDVWNAEIPAVLEVSADGQKYETVREFSARWPVSSVNFPEVTVTLFPDSTHHSRSCGRLGFPPVCQGHSA